MAVLRKIILFVIALVVGIGAYFAYQLVTKPPAIEVGGGYTVVKTEKPAQILDDSQGSIGDTVIGQTEVSEFNLLDADGNLKSRFGFDKLVHSEGTEWELEKPYVDMYDPKYTCRVRAKGGLINIEMVAGKPVPVSAKLNEDVVINLKTEDGGRDFDIHLDSLVYDIVRNRFESDDQLRLIADDMEMVGKGMTLVYNPENNRIELLKIPDLDYIEIKERRLKLEDGTVESRSDSLARKAAGSGKLNPQEGVLYEFILDENVKILTENETINASNVRISNILWGQSEDFSEQKTEEQGKVTDTEQKIKSLPVKSEDGFEYWQPDTDLPKPIAKQDKVNIEGPNYEMVRVLYVTCDGGLIFRPLDNQDRDKDIERTLDLIGSPVKVESESFVTESPYLWCGLDSETLRLYSRQQGQVKLTTPDGKASLVTEKSLFWSQGDSVATVKGPGHIFVADDKDETRTKLNFSDTIKMKLSQCKVRNVQVSGGFNADITGSNFAQINSGKAFMEFEGDNLLKNIELSDNVKITSLQGGVQSDRVSVDFATDENGKPQPQNALATGSAKLVASGEESKEYNPVMFADTIEYSFDDQVAVASGNIKLDFVVPSKDGNVSMPLTINADRNVVYKAGDGYIEFNDNVRGISVITQDGVQQQSKFTCDKLRVYLSNESVKPSLKSILLEGSKVVLENKRFTPEAVISVVDLECSGFEYEAVNGIMRASGPGNIKVNNRNVVGNSSQNSVSFNGPCYALIENFSSLTFNTFENQIVAERGEKMLHIGYIPILPDGNMGTQRLVDAGRLELSYTEHNGKSIVSSLKATDKVYYYEPDKYQLIGDNLEYNGYTGLVKINGTESNPCVLNSTLVDAIEYNIKTGSMKTGIGGVSSVPIN